MGKTQFSRRLERIYPTRSTTIILVACSGQSRIPYAPPHQLTRLCAKVTTDDPVEVSTRLFGDDGHGHERAVDILFPSSSTVLPFRHYGHLRFSPSTFALLDGPTKETNALDVPSVLIQRWTNARDQALEADVDDELPEAPALLTLLSSAGKGEKTQGDDNMDTSQTPTLKKCSALPLDEEIDVGEEDGEFVLASDHKGRRDHWPARVVGVHQHKRTKKWFYKVCYLDGKRKSISRNQFFTSDEDGFATCQVSVESSTRTNT
jgi:hypothetical protein